MRKILLVEDEADILQLYKVSLTQAGYEVDEARDGEEGLAKTKATTYDMVLLDIMLPKKTGIEILAEMKQDPKTSSQPVYMLTNFAQDDLIKDAFAKGAVGYVIKSQSSPTELVTEISTYFAKQQATPAS